MSELEAGLGYPGVFCGHSHKNDQLLTQLTHRTKVMNLESQAEETRPKDHSPKKQTWKVLCQEKHARADQGHLGLRKQIFHEGWEATLQSSILSLLY